MNPTAVSGLIILAAAFGSVLAPAGSPENPKLSDELSGSVETFRISGDGTTVVYRAKAATGGNLFELWTVPIDGSASPVRLHAPHPQGIDSFFPFSSDSAKVYFRGTLDTPAFELYVAPSDGAGTPLKLSGPLTHCSVTGLSCETAGDCPATGHCAVGGAVCLTNLDCGGMFNPCLGLAPQSCDPTGQVPWYLPSPDDAWVAYRADHDVRDVFELYSVRTDGSASPIKLNGPLPFPPLVQGGWFLIGAGNRVAYWTDMDIGKLYSVPIDGSAAPIQLAGPLVSGGYVRTWTLTRDGTRVVYRADQDTAGLVEIYSVPIDGSAAAVKLNGPVTGPGTSYALSHDHQHVVYPAGGSLFTVPIDGSAPPVQLNPPLGAGETITDFTVSGDIPRVGYSLCGGGGVCAIHAVPVDGSGAPIEVVPPTPGLDILFLGSQSGRLLYWLYPTPPDNQTPLLSVPFDGSQPPVMLNDPLAPGGVVSLGSSHGVLDQRGSLRIYTAHQLGSDGEELNVVPLTRSLPPVKVNGPLLSGDVTKYEVDPTEAWAVYIAEQDAVGDPELYSRHLDRDADGTPDETDNCAAVANAAQGPVVFSQTLRASTRTEFSWITGVDDVLYVRGPLDSVGSYATDAIGALADAVAFEDVTEPAPGSALYYLVRFGGDCTAASWQTAPGAEPARDASLP